MTLPAIGALRERWPEAQIEILGYPHITELACGRYYADATRSIDAKPLSGFFIPHAILDPDLKEYFGSFQLAISYLFDPDAVFADNVRRCGVKQLIEGSPRPAELPAAAHYCQPLEKLAIFVESPRPRVYPNAADRAFAEQYLAGMSAGRIAAIHPGSGSEQKNWAPEKFAALGRWLMTEWQAQLLVIQGEADEEAVGRLMEELPGQPVKLVRGLKLVELAAVVERCALFVGNDSGITHLAAAVGVPTLALFGPGSVAIWEPRGAKVRVVRFGDRDVVDAQAAARELLKSLGTGHLP